MLSELTELPPLPPDMRHMTELSIDEKRKRKAEWLDEHGIGCSNTDAGIDRAFAQARQRRCRAEAVAAGDSRRAELERCRRQNERFAYQSRAEVRPSSQARMARRQQSLTQQMSQRCYNRSYQEQYRKETRGCERGRITYGSKGRKMQMLSAPVQRKKAPRNGGVYGPYGHAVPLNRE